jgi:DNA topoisomerase-1
LFQYYDDDGNHRCISSSDINNYLKTITGEDFTAKDFRCWAGSVNALGAFQKLSQPEIQTEFKHKVVEVLDEVASKLGNTRTVCKKYYVHPTVIAAFEKGTIWKYQPKNSKSELNGEEYALVILLENETIVKVLG